MVRLAKRGGKLMVYVLVSVMSTSTLAAIVNHGYVILKVKVLRNFKFKNPGNVNTISSKFYYGLHMTHAGCTLPYKSLIMLTHSREDCIT